MGAPPKVLRIARKVMLDCVRANSACLYKEEDERLLLVGGVADDQHTPLLRKGGPSGDDRPHVCMALVLEDDEVFRADKHPSRPLRVPTRHRDEQVGPVVHRVRPPSHHMIETEVKLVEGEVLLCLTGCVPTGILHTLTHLCILASLQCSLKGFS